MTEGTHPGNGFVLLLRASSSLEASMLQCELEGEGIPVFLTGGQGAISFGELPSDALLVDVYVPAKKLEEARAVYARHTKEPPPDERGGAPG